MENVSSESLHAETSTRALNTTSTTIDVGSLNLVDSIKPYIRRRFVQSCAGQHVDFGHPDYMKHAGNGAGLATDRLFRHEQILAQAEEIRTGTPAIASVASWMKSHADKSPEEFDAFAKPRVALIEALEQVEKENPHVNAAEFVLNQGV